VLDAGIVLTSKHGGRRTLPAGAFFQGLFQTAIRPDEVLTKVFVPRPRPRQRFAFQEVARRRGDYAILGLAAAAAIEGGTLAEVRLCFFGTGDRPVLALAAAERLNGQPASRIDIAAASEAIGQDVEFTGDPQASAALRRHLAGVLLRRALDDIIGSPAGGHFA
jgi:carbon-monoxide dehydrogenase medium subunit